MSACKHGTPLYEPCLECRPVSPDVPDTQVPPELSTEADLYLVIDFLGKALVHYVKKYESLLEDYNVPETVGENIYSNVLREAQVRHKDLL